MPKIIYVAWKEVPEIKNLKKVWKKCPKLAAERVTWDTHIGKEMGHFPLGDRFDLCLDLSAPILDNLSWF